MNLPDPEPIDPKKLLPGPIQHESLPDELLERIRSIYEVVGPYLETTLEQFEIGFMRDSHPESEVVAADVGRKLLACYDALGEELE